MSREPVNRFREEDMCNQKTAAGRVNPNQRDRLQGRIARNCGQSAQFSD